MTQEQAPTFHTEVDALLTLLREGAADILGEELVGLYLYGSIALGAFDPTNSDIDFLIVTESHVTPSAFARLDAMHAAIKGTGLPLSDELEGSYIDRKSLRRHTPGLQHPHIDRGGGLGLEVHECDWIIQRHVLKTHGLTITGPHISTLIDPISPESLRAAVVELMSIWWGPMADDPPRLTHAGYRAYAVMTMCRTLYTLRCGGVASKPEAVAWAETHLGARWEGLPTRALSWRRGDPAVDLDKTVELIKFTFAESKEAT